MTGSYVLKLLFIFKRRKGQSYLTELFISAYNTQEIYAKHFRVVFLLVPVDPLRVSEV